MWDEREEWKMGKEEGTGKTVIGSFSSQTDGIHVLNGYNRPDKNSRRTQYGCKRLCMPPVPTDIFIDAVKSAVLANANWVPPHGQGSLYLRPLIIGTGPIRRPPCPPYSDSTCMPCPKLCSTPILEPQSACRPRPATLL